MTARVTPLFTDLAGLRVLMTLDAVGGVWRYAIDLATGLRYLGCEVVFAGFGPPPDPARQAEAARIGMIDWTPAPLDWMARDAASLGPAQDRLKRLVRIGRADILHLNAPPLAAGCDLGLPVVAVAHSCLATWHRAVRGGTIPPDRAWHADGYGRGLAAAGLVVTPSAAHADLLGECYAGLPRPRVVANAVATLPPAPAAETGCFALAAGRWWDEGKNGAVLDRAAPQMALPLRMAGPTTGPEGTTFVARHAAMVGDIRHADLRRLMAQATVFVAPSVYEPFGLAVAEAAQAGLPLVLSDIPTFRELWPETAATFVAPGDAAGFAAAVNRLATDPVQARQQGEAAREHAARFRPARLVAAMAAIYSGLLSDRRSPLGQAAQR